MNILVAGVNGYIGGRLGKYLSKKHNIFNYKKKIPKKLDVIINVAGPDHDGCRKNPKKCITDRISINKKLLKITKARKIKKYIYISTIHVYKKNKTITENTKLDYSNPYSLSHINSEKFIKKILNQYLII
jgi:nucleoside-diphosphate-sugar epimerase